MAVKNRILGLVVLMAMGVIYGCSSSTTPPAAPAPAPAPLVDNSSDPGGLTADTTSDANNTSEDLGNGGLGNSGLDGDAPLKFEPTAEEKAKQAADGPLPSIDSRTILDRVPKPLKKGPVGSLGRALFKGVLGADAVAQDDDVEPPSPESEPEVPSDDDALDDAPADAPSTTDPEK